MEWERVTCGAAVGEFGDGTKAQNLPSEEGRLGGRHSFLSNMDPTSLGPKLRCLEE